MSGSVTLVGDRNILNDVDHLIKVTVGLGHVKLVEGVDAGSCQGVESTREGVHGTTIGNHQIIQIALTKNTVIKNY